MNKVMKRILGILLALAVVAGCGFFARDAKLKATDEEILPEEGTTREIPEEVASEEVVVEENEEYTVSEVVITPVGDDAEAPDAEPSVEAEEAPEEVKETEEVEEAEEVKETEEAEETEEVEETPKSITLRYETEGELHFGMKVTIRSELKGYGENVTYQWLYSTDNKEWKPISGANEDTYEFILDEVNNWYYWQLNVEEAE